MIINSVNDFCTHFGTDEKHLKRDIYKYTDCGAWICWDRLGMTIGSIVEGSDAEFSRLFIFPCTSEEVDNWLNELEVLTDEAWHEANE